MGATPLKRAYSAPYKWTPMQNGLFFCCLFCRLTYWMKHNSMLTFFWLTMDRSQGSKQSVGARGCLVWLKNHEKRNCVAKLRAFWCNNAICYAIRMLLWLLNTWVGFNLVWFLSPVYFYYQPRFTSIRLWKINPRSTKLEHCQTCYFFVWSGK